MTLLVAAGALSIVAQVVVLRELVAALYGVELLYVLALGSWLVGTAIGAAAGRHVPATRGTGIAGCLALGLLVPAEVILLRTAGPLAGTVTGADLPFPEQVTWIAAATLPPAAIAGALFSVLAGVAAAVRGTSAGRSYGIESAGAAAGGAAVTLAMGLGASTFQLAVAAPAAAVAAALAAAGPWPRRRRFALAGVAMIAGAVIASRAAPLDTALLRRMYPSLVAAADTPYARVAIVRRDSQVAVFENGALAFDTESLSAEAFADITAAQHPNPQRALVVGGGGEGVPDSLARHGIRTVDNVEVDKRAYGLVRAETADARSRSEPAGRVTVFFEEPRRWLERAAPYDLVLVAAGEPIAGASSRFYTREFFALCASRLTPGGVVAIRLAAAENVWPAPLVRRTASIVAAVREVFSAVELVPGATLYVFASNRALSADPAVLSGRLLGRGLRPRLITPPYLRYLYTNDRRDGIARLLEAAPPEGPNRDGAPACYQYAAATWLSKFYPRLAATAGPARSGMGWPLAVALAGVAAVAMAWARRRQNRRIAVSLLAIGFIGMVLETILLLRFQIMNGVIYQQVGWLLTCFMAGIAAGSLATSGRNGLGGRLTRRALAVPLAPLGAALVSVAAVTWLPATSGLAGTSVLLAASGAAIGLAFASGASVWQGQARGAASVLYAADVAGGAAGAAAATLVLVPAAGFEPTAFAMAALAAALLLVTPRCGSGGR